MPASDSRAGASLSITREAEQYVYSLESPGSKIEDVREVSELRGPIELIRRVLAEKPREGDLDRLGLAGGTDRIAVRQNKRVLTSIGYYVYQNLLTRRVAGTIRDLPLERLSLLLDDSLVSVPWELTNDGSDFFCMKYALSRRIRSQARPGPQRRARGETRILLVEDPTGTLPGSRDEVTYIVGTLLRVPGIKVRRGGMEMGKREFLGAIARGDIDILHYSGHGSFVESEPHRSHLHLRNDELCHAYEIAGALSPSCPSLIFSNACSSARTIRGIEGLARAFLSGGASTYIGTLWPVTDDLAGLVGAEFYRYLIHGRAPAEALKKARLNAYRKFGWTSLSWAAYLLVQSS